MLVTQEFLLYQHHSFCKIQKFYTQCRNKRRRTIAKKDHKNIIDHQGNRKQRKCLEQR